MFFKRIQFVTRRKLFCSSSYPDADRVRDEELNDDVDLPVIEERDWQLVLPSGQFFSRFCSHLQSFFYLLGILGATIGHRSLLRYYKQRLKTDTQVSVAVKKQAVHRLLHHYRALGWTGTTGKIKIRIVKYHWNELFN